MNLKSKEFKALRNKWYSKLKRNGFQDAETAEGFLKEYHSTKFAKGVGAEEKRRYYELAGHLLNSYPFPDKISETMWRYHASGMSTWEIAERVGFSTGVVERFIKFMEGHFKGV